MIAPVPIQLHQRPGTLVAQLYSLAKAHPNEICLVLIDHDGEQRLTYEQFITQAARYREALKTAGIGRGDLTALVLPHGGPVMFGFWGAMLLGAVPSIFPFLSDKQDPEHYFATVRELVAHSGVKAVITSSEFESSLHSALAGLDTLLLTEKTLKTGGDLTAYPNTDILRADDVAFLQHSSGSTGLQKGVMLSHRAVINQISSYSFVLKLSRSDVVVSWLPLYHDMGLIAGFILPIMQGIKLVLMSPFHWVRDPKILFHAVHRHQGTLCWLPNFAYSFLATRLRDSDIQDLDLSTVRAFINCSEPVYAKSHQTFFERFKDYGLRPDALKTCYAMAENTFAVTQSDLETSAKLHVVDTQQLMEKQRIVPAVEENASTTLVSCGRPIPGCQIQIVDEARQPLSEGHVGEIALQSDSMLSGYYRRPDATDVVMQDGWYFTGDRGYIFDGELYITGRKKDLIIVGGKNIYPQDIENLLNDIPSIHPGRVVVFGLFNDQLGTEDIAVVAEVDSSDEQVRTTISRDIRARIAQSTEVTARYVYLVDAGWLIKTTSGKVARSANREKFIRERMLS